MSSPDEPIWDESPEHSPNLDEDLLFPLAFTTFEAASTNQSDASFMRKWRVTVLMVRTCWRLRLLQTSHQKLEDSPLSFLKTRVHLIVAVRRLKFTLPRLKAKRAQNLNFLVKMQSAEKCADKPLLHVFRSVARGVLFATILHIRVSRTYLQCTPLKEALALVSTISKVKLDDTLNARKCKVIMQFFTFLETYLSIFGVILDNIPKEATKLEGLSKCYYILKEICRSLNQCRQYVRDCTGSFPSGKIFAKLESSTTIRGLISDLDRCLQLLSTTVNDFVERCSFWEDLDTKPTCLKVFGSSMDYYLHLQAEKDRSDLLVKLKSSARSFWRGLDSSKVKQVRELLIYRLEYERRPGREIDYLKHGLCVDPKNVRILRIVGAGSFGIVQEVECFDETYAMKTIVSELENATEAIIQAGLDHPNIVKLVWYTTNVDPKNNRNTLSLLMEFMDMGLDAYLEQRNHQRRPPLAKYPLAALHILQQIARAMKYLHSQEIMHRDLKAANVLVDLSWSPDFKDGFLHVKVCDFGLSKVKQAGATLMKDRNTAKVGTRYWRAPEVLIPYSSSSGTMMNGEDEELARYSFCADVYSYAMTCYEVLTGKKPFAENRQAGLKERIITKNERPILPEADLHGGLVALIKRCWDVRPEIRPSFDVICDELDRVKADMLFGNSSSSTQVSV